jgi:hypothetical protein
MRKAMWAILTPLLLLAGPLFVTGPSGASSDEPRLRAVESPGFPAARPANPLARPIPPLKSRSPHEGPGAPPAPARAASGATFSFDLRVLQLNSPPHSAPVTGSARQLPAFPTGPPSHS